VKRLMLPAGLALAAVTPGTAVAAVKSEGGATKVPVAFHAPTKVHGPKTAHARAYERAYHEVARKFGPRTPGRNIVKDGLPGGRPLTDARVVASLVVLQRMLAPPPPPPAPTYSAPASSAPAPAAAPASSAGASGGPACASESGTNYSTGPSNTNSSSGATGRYQILPSTAAGYGCDMSTPAGQDACAQTIYDHQGASAWVGCGG
jgi:hypothetical protein